MTISTGTVPDPRVRFIADLTRLKEVQASLAASAGSPHECEVLSVHLRLTAAYLEHIGGPRPASVSKGQVIVRPGEEPAGDRQASYVRALSAMAVSGDAGAAALADRLLLDLPELWPGRASLLGTRRYEWLEVAEARPSGRDAVLIRLSVPAHLRECYKWAAGQHVSVAIQRAGVTLARNYSICAPPSDLAEEGTISIAVRRQQHGQVSAFLCATAARGKRLKVRVPHGAMTWAPDSGMSTVPVLLVAGGSGVTPLASIAASVLQTGSGRIALLVIERRIGDIMLGPELQRLRTMSPGRFTFRELWTREGAGRPSADVLLGELRELLRAIAGGGDVDAVPSVYLCGPDSLMDLAEGALLADGVPGSAIRRESFAGSHQAPATPAFGPGGPVTVQTTAGPRTISVGPGESLLAAMLRLGIDHPSSCLAGQCHTCRITVLSDNVGPAAALLPEGGGATLACLASPMVRQSP